jgi:type VI secretion system protein ImpC
MSRPSFTKVEIETGERREAVDRPEAEDPFHIAILGDFSGRENRGELDPKLHGRKPVLVDRDNFDEVLAHFAPELQLPLGGLQGPRIPIHFRELDDFHPDRIFEKLKIFQALRQTREWLNDRSTFDGAAEEVRSWSGGGTPKSSQPPATSGSGASRLSARELFEETLKATESRSAASQSGRALDDFQALVRDIVAPYVEPKPDPQGPKLIAQVDAAISGQMRALLHNPDFQALEALWRGVSFLVRRLSTGVDLKVFLIDIAKPELGSDLVATYELLIEKSIGTPGAEPWAVLAGNYTFDRSDADLALLARMAAVARHAGAPFLAAASSSVLDRKPRADPEAARSWDALRRLAQATWMGLALPRFLLRLPFGKQTESTEAFEFEEFPAEPRHEDYLWGNPALACAYLLGEAFSESGWRLRPGEINEISGLPAHVYRADGEPQLKPCAEALLTEDAAEAMLDQGLMPLLSTKGSDSVRLLRFQSIAEPVAPLAGRWS